MGLAQSLLLRVGARQRTGVDVVRGVSRLHASRDPVQAVREAGPHDASDAGTAATDQSVAEEVLERSPAASHRDAEAAEGTRLQSADGLPADAAAGTVFIGLFHVLRSFNRTGTGVGQLGLSPEENAQLGNYAFSPDDVQSFLSARIFNAPISSWITQPIESLQAFTIDGGSLPSRLDIAVVAIPLMVIAGIATHFNSRASVARQSAQAAAAPQAAIMNKLALYVFPLGVMVGGPFLPIAILLYWVSNNVWTYGQQHLVFRKIDREEEEKRQEALTRRNENAPKPAPSDQEQEEGRRSSAAATDAEPASEDSSSDDTTAQAGDVSLKKIDPQAGGKASGASTPKPGSRPKNSKRKRR